MVAILVTSILPNCGCNSPLPTKFVATIWKFVSATQELLLLAVISPLHVSSSLVRVLHSLGFVDFSAIARVVSVIFPAELQGEAGHNAFPDDGASQYHPYIFSCLPPLRIMIPRLVPYLVRTDIGQDVSRKCNILTRVHRSFAARTGWVPGAPGAGTSQQPQCGRDRRPGLLRRPRALRRGPVLRCIIHNDNVVGRCRFHTRRFTWVALFSR